MPVKRLRLTCHHVFTLIAVTLLVSDSVEAQTGRVAMQATVSETVALSVAPNLTHGNVRTDVMSSGNTVRITLSGVNSEAEVIRLPLLVRSNSSFRISAAVETKTATTQLSVVDVRATGMLVSPQAISGLNVPRHFDLRGLNKSTSSAQNLVDDARPLFVISGPRVSLGGTPNSPSNALLITLLIDLKPQTAPEWLVHLTFVGTPGQPVQ